MEEEFLKPQYVGELGGTTIANVPATVAHWLGADFAGLPTLPETHWPMPKRSAKRVVLIILDALGRNLIERNADMFAPLLNTAVVNQTITSVFPSTTVNALTCLWTGVAPASHGLIGLYLYFPQFGTVGQMLSMSPAAVRVPDSLTKTKQAAIEPEKFLSVPGMAEQLARAGVATYAYKPSEIIDSVLSRMHGRGVARNFGAITFADMLSQIRQQLELPTPERLFISAYWPTIDTLSHIYGPHSPSVTAELEALTHQLRVLLLEALSPAAREETLICLVADHGQLNMPQHLMLDETPDLQKMLLIENSGEPRTPYLYARQGQSAALLAYLQTHFADKMVPYTAVDIINDGLLGPEPPTSEIAQRLGDVVPLMRPGHGFIPTLGRGKKGTFDLIGMHGGLAPDEMRVPWLVF